MHRGVTAALAALLALAPMPPAAARPAAERHALPGLSAPASITVDRWGISHIRAASPRDAFAAQGYAVARDRLWQIDLWRKRGLGRLSASFGPAYVAQDRAARLLLYRGDMAAEWAAYAPDARAWTEAFVAGVNAFIAETETGRQPLPEEFAATRTRPERWAADDVVRIRSNGLTRNIGEEVARARALCRGDVALEPLRRRLEPAHAVTVPDGLDPCAIPADVLETYRLGTAGVRFDGVRLAFDAEHDLRRQEGSNNWVVAGHRTATGRPIMANDPHREHSVPSLRWLVHLDAPGLHIAGAGEPALPGISFGHNEDAAWGITIFNADQQDLVVHAAGTPVSTVTETIEVQGEAPRAVTLAFSAEGPVIHGDPAAGPFHALRATWARPGAAAYFQATRLFGARGWDDFGAAVDAWGAPNLNIVWADRQGTIGWAPAGDVPVRAGHDGLLPMPGSARWTGLLPPAQMPRVRDPRSGWFATANEMNLPPGFPHVVGFEWADRSRRDRIGEVLSGPARFTLADMAALQTDTVSPQARRFAALVAGASLSSDGARAAQRLLAGWDGSMTADSAAAALHEIWLNRHLPPAMVAALVPPGAQTGFGRPDAAGMLATLTGEALPAAFAPDAARRNAILDASLAAAWSDAVARLGPDPARWRWGTLHRALFTPALAVPGRDAARTVGPLPVGGSATTPMATSHRASGGGSFDVAAGASVRMVLDVGAWDNSLVVNMPGQSGNAADPHYRDLFPIWAAGKLVPFAWSRAAVDKVAERVITLTPTR